jgi:hypothetical protein
MVNLLGKAAAAAAAAGNITVILLIKLQLFTCACCYPLLFSFHR